MTTNRRVHEVSLTLDETPQEAACAISQALEFLRGEANRIGMQEVADLIGRASGMARTFAAKTARGPISPDNE